VMERFGTDAFRFTLAALAAQGRDIRLSEQRIEGFRNFANKLWNAARLVLTNLEGYDVGRAPAAAPALADRWIEGRLAETIVGVRDALDAYRFNDAASAIYQFLWNDYCDWYLEIAKRSLYGDDAAARARTQHTLVTVLEPTLRLLHPFMPFITEEIWQRLPHAGDSIMVAPYPRGGDARTDAGAAAAMAAVMGVVTAIRNIRGEMRVAPGVKLTVIIRPRAGDGALFSEQRPLVEALARAAVTVDANAARPRQSALAVVGAAEVYVDLAGVVDVGAERQRLEKEIRRIDDTIAFTRAKLARPDFVERAPAEIVEKEREKLSEQEAVRAKLAASLGWIDDRGR